ncbi:hypothetical protein OG871_11925 [Kitasatospora sp. NBC_00374]|uniref:hypothetical protein n=1 Tax=Kitasatospora sp. NBC_00374 TaxID=2975964 RepID=UPI00324757EC
MQAAMGALRDARVLGRVRSVKDAVRMAESVLLGGGQRRARRNAWSAVCENRRYAADRVDGAAAPGRPDQARQRA